MSKPPDIIIAHLGLNGNEQAGSGATSPGAEWREDEGDQQSRYRPRTLPYKENLPYKTEDESEAQAHLGDIVRNLYISIEARDFSPGAVRWSRELRGWLSLKFDPPRKTRAKLVKLYYELAMAPGLDPPVSERFSSMFMTLTKYFFQIPLFFSFFFSLSFSLSFPFLSFPFLFLFFLFLFFPFFFFLSRWLLVQSATCLYAKTSKGGSTICAQGKI